MDNVLTQAAKARKELVEMRRDILSWGADNVRADYVRRVDAAIAALDAGEWDACAIIVRKLQTDIHKGGPRQWTRGL